MRPRPRALPAALAAAAIGLTAAAAGAEPPRLVGTIVAPGRAAAAVFEDGAGRQALRRVGDPVVPGLTLAAVRRGAVEVRDPAGRAITLHLRTAAGSAERSGGGDEGLDGPTGSAGPTKPLAPPHAGLVPAADGDIEGLRLTAGAPDSPLVRAGLEPGDLIVAIDHRSLGAPGTEEIEALSRAITEAHAAGRPLVLEVRRGAAPLRVEVRGSAR